MFFDPVVEGVDGAAEFAGGLGGGGLAGENAGDGSGTYLGGIANRWHVSEKTKSDALSIGKETKNKKMLLLEHLRRIWYISFPIFLIASTVSM